jgi:cytochrome c peroxidase
VFFHNGVFHALEDAVRFYARSRKLDDLPASFVKNVDVLSPFDRHRGAPPAMNDAEIEDVVAFLGTLTDGFGAPRASATGQ